MAESVRVVERTFRGSPTLEGAGVRLRRMFGNTEVPLLDPFLLLDNFGTSDPADYVKGFPWHPHRGIETVTYMLSGTTEHEDSLGNKGAIDSGDVQWMSAGSGIMHQEMPKRTDGLLSGYQLWVNLPRERKMENPAYRGVTSQDIPVVAGEDGRRVKVIAGRYQSVEGPVRHIPVDPTYLDVQLPAGAEFRHAVPRGHTVFAQVMDGAGTFDPLGAPAIGERRHPLYTSSIDPPHEEETRPGHTILYGDGDAVEVRAGAQGLRFLLVSGRPLHEPVSWYGPIVMNTRDEILEAMGDLRRGTFIRAKTVLDEG